MSTSTLKAVLSRGRVGLWPLAGAVILALVLACVASVPAGNAAFPGANGKLVFLSYRDGSGTGEIYVMKADGSGQTNLTNTPAGDESFARWSPDGTKIAFEGGPDWWGQEIYVMNADGTNVIRLTSNGAFDGHPTWSPDGTKIAFLSFRDGQAEIYVMNAGGSGQTNLTNDPLFDERPAWSPDGSKIAFDRQTGPTTFDVFVMNANGSGQTRLTFAGGGNATWSPDGTKIAFFWGRDGLADIYVMNADGSGQTNLTSSPGSSDDDPAWSPDGTKIAFHSDRDGNGEVYVMNADGSDQTNLTNNPAVDGLPDWQPLSEPTSKGQCKNNGWRNYPQFRNQGDCVSFVATAGKK